MDNSKAFSFSAGQSCQVIYNKSLEEHSTNYWWAKHISKTITGFISLLSQLQYVKFQLNLRKGKQSPMKVVTCTGAQKGWEISSPGDFQNLTDKVLSNLI